MSDENNTQEKFQKKSPNKRVFLVIGIAIGITVICFTIVAILPPPKGPHFDDPLRSLLIGLGLLGFACPLYIAGLILKKRSATSLYFEESFMKAVVNVFGFLCFILGLICIGLSIFASVKWVLDYR